MNNKTILDVCCGSRMFYFDKHNKNTIYMDCRELDETLCDGRNLVIAPDVVGDFRSIPLLGQKRSKTHWLIFFKE